MTQKRSFPAQFQAMAANLDASRRFIAVVDRIDASAKLAYLKRPGQVQADAQGYLGHYGVVAGLTVPVTVSLDVAGHTYTTTVQVQIFPPLAADDRVLVQEVGGSLLVLGLVDKP